MLVCVRVCFCILPPPAVEYSVVTNHPWERLFDV